MHSSCRLSPIPGGRGSASSIAPRNPPAPPSPRPAPAVPLRFPVAPAAPFPRGLGPGPPRRARRFWPVLPRGPLSPRFLWSGREDRQRTPEMTSGGGRDPGGNRGVGGRENEVDGGVAVGGADPRRESNSFALPPTALIRSYPSAGNVAVVSDSWGDEDEG